MHNQLIGVTGRSAPTYRVQEHQNPYYFDDNEYDHVEHDDYPYNDESENHVRRHSFSYEAHEEFCRERTCMPHAVHGFHLRDHVWRKLLVRNIELKSTENPEFQGLRIQGGGSGS